MKTTARLIAVAISDRLQEGVRFGLLARSLPPFDTYTLYTALLSNQLNWRLALLGFEDVDDRFPPEVGREVETVVGWRNDPSIAAHLVVILNPIANLEKIHSLGLLEPFTDQDLRRAICRLGAKEAQNSSQYLKAKVWMALQSVERPDRQGFHLVANQVAAFYHALQTQEVSEALTWLGLLPDSELSVTNEIEKELQDNHGIVEWLSGLDSKDLRTLARALSQEGEDFRLTFKRIKAYLDSPTRDTLQALTLQEVRKLREAPKSPERRKAIRRTTAPGNLHLVDQLLRAASEENIKERRKILKHLEDQATRIGRLFFRDDIPDDWPDELPDLDADAKDDFEPLQDYWTGEEVGRIEKPEGDQQHPLLESFQKWMRPLCWGGQIEAEVADLDDSDLSILFSNRIPLHFRPLRPLNANDPNSLMCLFQDLEKVARQAGVDSQLVSLFQGLDEQRRFLLQYHEQFLYYPQYAVQNPEIYEHLQAYLEIYNELGGHLQQISRQLQVDYPDAIQTAIAKFLALDSVVIRLNAIHQPDRPSRVSVLLTSLHPLHLWKWLQLTKYLVDLPRPLTEREQAKVCQAVNRLPTLLNVFVFHPVAYEGWADQPEIRLVLAGEIGDPGNENIIGIPYYQPIGHQVAGIDGLKAFSSFLRSFLILYPPSQLGLSLVIIDPPHLAPILTELLKLHKANKREIHLEGTRLSVFWTRPPVYDEWQSRDEEALQIFREDPRWMLYMDLESRSLDKIHQELQQRKIYPHVVLLCDPSTAVARSVFRTAQDETTPFGLPIQLTYDQISDTVRIVPAANGGIFDVYAGLHHILTGDLNRTILGVGSRGAKPDDLRYLLNSEPGAHWLAILDWPQGTLEMPSDLGRRLLWRPTETRTLTIHTREKDWEEYWQEKLQFKLGNWHLPVSLTNILDYLLELAPLLPNGLLDLIQAAPSDFVDVLDESSLAEMLGVLTVLRWYRQEHPGLVLLPIGGEDFGDWYGTADFRGQEPPYYMALWIENGRLRSDLLAVHTIIPLLRSRQAEDELEQLATFAQSLEMLFDEATSKFILTPLRRAVLRERLITTIFAASATTDSLLVENKQTKSEWAKALNELFTSQYRPLSRLLYVDVLLEEKSNEITLRRIPRRDSDSFERYHATVPGGLLNLKGAVAETMPPPISVRPSPPLSTPFEESSATEPLDGAPSIPSPDLTEVVVDQASRLHRVLDAYGLAVARVDAGRSQIGPRFIRYWVQLMPPAGRLSEVQKYAEDIAREMGSRSVPFIDNILGERYIGIDLARDEPVSIPLRQALDRLPESEPDRLLIAAGQNPAGEDVTLDLVRLPHMLIAGQTGSGKTIFLSALITSMTWRHTPAELQLILVDPKQTDFGVFSTLPHLVDNRILYEPEQAIETLRNLLQAERPRRIELIRQANCPNNLEYNRRNPANRMPWLVVVIDEFADLILSLNRNEREKFEKQINRLAATGRSTGIHLLIATQRPTTDIVTGTIKANITARVSFRLPSQIDSRTILDRPGAENLLGQGDMLVSINNDVQRLQGYYASYDEFRQLVAALRR